MKVLLFLSVQVEYHSVNSLNATLIQFVGEMIDLNRQEVKIVGDEKKSSNFQVQILEKLISV